MLHIERYTDSVIAEILLRKRQYDGQLVTSVFFGGGTPSLLTPSALSSICDALRQSYNISSEAEWTMECNPGTVSIESLSAYHNQGINRLSFGVQSFTPSELLFLDRIHSADDAVNAMTMARSAGFDNVNMDLMFAVPGQTIESLRYNINRMIALCPEHISAYSLIYEHGTPLYAKLKKGLIKPLSEDVDAHMYKLVIDALSNAGYHQYEVSNFAKQGKQCRHNLTYWHANPYLAFGPSAHGFVGGIRYWNKRSLTSWMADISESILPEANRETLSEQEALSEYLFLHLRADGVPIDTVEQTFGIDLRTALQPNLAYWIEEGFVSDSENILRLTAEGYRVCDELSLKVIEAVEAL